ncbi:Sec-independent protein translocase protein TatB [Thalassospira xiamenensis]|uniref:Sec-independent protein translocase protein TatB n=1 Tax=Thalassospira xiamenensis TaxID=220697 RepID=UPI000DEDCC2B|nr:Sec-independent protein translocase protein TatB [Thalassospira xiamenensis]RCK42955.1 TatABCE protein translocation system subunit [Thalassospira xiamenensis]
MFDIGWTEMALVAVVALFVVGPKDLPHVLYKLAGYWKKVRGMAREFQGGIDNLIREAELDDLRKQVTDARSSTSDFIENKIAEPKQAKPADKTAESETDNKSETKTTAPKTDAAASAKPAAADKKTDHPESQA